MPLNYASVEFEYKKNQTLKKEDVQCLQEWLKKQPHLPKLHELEIINFLLSCNYSVERTKVTIDNHYTLKGLTPEIFGRRDLKTWEDTLDNVLTIPLPKWTPEGYQILYTKLKNKNLNKFNFLDASHCAQLLLKMSILERESSDGLVFIFDWEGMSLGHITQIPLLVVRKLIAFMQEGLPLKLKQFHAVNTNTYLDKFMAIVTPFVKKELMEMVHIHSDYPKTLYSYVPPECLPKELGGEGDSIFNLQDQIRTLVLNNIDFLEEDAAQVTDESKRPQKSNRFNHLFGIEGTFKKLELD